MAHSTPVDRGVIVIAEMRIVPVVLIAAGIVAAAASANAQTAPAPASSGLTVERVAQLPSIIGTAPASPTWSPDSRWIAFRWNESGWPFRDVYVVRADGTGLKRLTDMQRTDPAPAPPGGTSTDALAAQAAARARGGVSEVQWLPDSRGLLFVSRGSVFRIGVDGGEPSEAGCGRRRVRHRALAGWLVSGVPARWRHLVVGARWRRRSRASDDAWRRGHRPRAARHLQPRRRRSRHRASGARTGRRLRGHPMAGRSRSTCPIAATCARCRSPTISAPRRR